ncbi:phenylacetate--CoA ligase family protein [Chryseobacterium sp.]|uniref:phenylacetate--CoA ligase family protein n=1 Tax=Chryseobacterium sp. TaxID=1871047 RepID=UPI0011CCC970|nr:AMP-binding protein [Chryseobacterium sp.]TXF76393.1 phenylacetate--CoA ligase [Chryseobacterium sp.]
MYPTIEYASPEEIKAFQEKKLQELLIYLSTNSKFYQTLFARENIQIEEIRTLEDLGIIPTTSKEDLQQFNQDFFCVSKDKIADFSTTSGTLGDPVSFGLSDADLDRLAYNEAISFACAGIKKGDLVQTMTTIDKRFMAGLAYFLGLRKLGAGIIRMGPGIPELQWDSILRYEPKFLITVPSFLLKLIEYAENHGIDYRNSSVFGAVCIGESLRNQDFSPSLLAKKITEKWDIKLYSTYASTEMSTAFTECEHQKGGHQHPELIITEILDENLKPVKEGESGELVITTLGVEALPLLRFRTGDIVKAHLEPCECGRTTLRLGPVIGRKQQMIKYKGTTLYPTAFDDLLNTYEGISAYQIIIRTNEIGTDEILVKISCVEESEKFIKELKDHFRAKLRVTPEVRVYEHQELLTMIHDLKSRKPIHFIDLRERF